jgi:hypothetical protein
VRAHPSVQSRIQDATSVAEIVASAKGYGALLEAIDLALSYRELNEDFWPWSDMSMQYRRHFIHKDYVDAGDIRGSSF